MSVTREVARNEQRILNGIQRAAADGADLLLTPEGSLSGYHSEFDREQVASAVERLRAAAREAAIGLALGTCYKETENGVEHCYNQVRLYSREDECLGVYAKILRCSPLDHPGSGEMQNYEEGALRTFDWGPIRLGVLICNDLWATPGFTTMPNPYLAWRLKQMGAQLILHPAFSGRDLFNRPYLEATTAMWARAVSLPIFQVNAIHGPDIKLNSPSGLIGPKGQRLVEVPDLGEQHFTCRIPLTPR
jgi:predicted amidohydrolase